MFVIILKSFSSNRIVLQYMYNLLYYLNTIYIFIYTWLLLTQGLKVSCRFILVVSFINIFNLALIFYFYADIS